MCWSFCVPEEYQSLIEDIVKDGRLYSSYQHQQIFKVKSSVHMAAFGRLGKIKMYVRKRSDLFVGVVFFGSFVSHEALFNVWACVCVPMCVCVLNIVYL